MEIVPSYYNSLFWVGSGRVPLPTLMKLSQLSNPEIVVINSLTSWKSAVNISSTSYLLFIQYKQLLFIIPLIITVRDDYLYDSETYFPSSLPSSSNQLIFHRSAWTDTKWVNEFRTSLIQIGSCEKLSGPRLVFTTFLYFPLTPFAESFRLFLLFIEVPKTARPNLYQEGQFMKTFDADLSGSKGFKTF